MAVRRTIGTEQDDRLDGRGGRDHIGGLGGDDTLFGGVGDDSLYGGDGDDYLDGGRHDDLLVGGWGENTIGGGLGDDLIYAVDESLTDSIAFHELFNRSDIEARNALVVAGDGNDTIYGSLGGDTLFGGQGDDVVHVDMGSYLSGINSSSNWVYGGDGNDALYSLEDNTLYGGQGDDTIRGIYGDHLLYGGEGDDEILSALSENPGDHAELYGGEGDDSLAGGGNTPNMYGGEGDDYLLLGSRPGQTGFPIVDGGDGFDVVALRTYWIDYSDYDFRNVEALDVKGAAYPYSFNAHTVPTVNESVVETANNQRLYLFGHDISVVHLEGDWTATGTVSDDRGAFTVYQLNDSSMLVQKGVAIHLDEFQKAADLHVGSDYDDFLLGQQGTNETLYGGAGDDRILGENTTGAADHVYGGDGNDVLRGNSGNFYGGPGDDVIVSVSDGLVDGGDGYDRWVNPANYVGNPLEPFHRINLSGDEFDVTATSVEAIEIFRSPRASGISLTAEQVKTFSDRDSLDLLGNSHDFLMLSDDWNLDGIGKSTSHWMANGAEIVAENELIIARHDGAEIVSFDMSAHRGSVVQHLAVDRLSWGIDLAEEVFVYGGREDSLSLPNDYDFIEKDGKFDVYSDGATTLHVERTIELVDEYVWPTYQDDFLTI